PGWRITLTTDPVPDAFDAHAVDDPLHGARRWVFFDADPPFLIVEESLDARTLQADPRVTGMAAVWYLTPDDPAAWLAHTGQASPRDDDPGCMFWTDREQALADLAASYAPLATLRALAQSGAEPLAG